MRTKVRVVAVALFIPLWAGTAWPQAEVAPVSRPDAVPEPATVMADDDSGAEAAAEAALLDDAALDELVAPVALYPDALLAQVLVAATYPLDVMKADRFLSENEGLADKDRSDQAAAQGWDQSVAVLAAGFPDVVQRMAADIDWTQDLGDAMVTQTDDVFDSVQRLRAQAVAAGNLASNAAQTVDAEGDSISIEPTDPGVVYVPAYDPEAAYVAPATAPVTTVAPEATSTGLTTSSLITTGVVAFGSAMLVDAIFDDDDDWDDYWHAPPPIRWDDGEFRPRPPVVVNGDVNIDRRRDRIGNGPLADSDWKPTPEQRRTAQDRIDTRQAAGGRVIPAGAARPAGGLDQAQRDKIKARGSASDVERKLQARAPAAEAGAGVGARAEAKKPMSSVLEPGRGDRSQVDRDAARGADSLKRDHKPAVAKQRAATGAKAKQVSRPEAGRTPQRAQPAHGSVLKKQGGDRARAASSRGRGERRH